MLPLVVLAYVFYWAYLYAKKRWYDPRFGGGGGAAAAPAKPARPALKVRDGLVVEVVGLARRADLNGAWGVVKGLDKEGGADGEKAPVYLRDGRRVLIRRTNLIEAKEMPPAARVKAASEAYGGKVRVVPAVPARGGVQNPPPEDLPMIVAAAAIPRGAAVLDDVVLVAQNAEDLDRVGACQRNDVTAAAVGIYGAYAPNHEHLSRYEASRPYFYDEPRLFERDLDAMERRRRDARYTTGLKPPQLTEKELAGLPASQREYHVHALHHLPVQGVSWPPVLTSFSSMLPTADQLAMIRNGGGVRFAAASRFANCVFLDTPAARAAQTPAHTAAAAPFGTERRTLFALRDLAPGEVLTVYRGNPLLIEPPLARPVLMKQQRKGDSGAMAPPAWAPPSELYHEPSRDVMLLPSDGGVQFHVGGVCQKTGAVNEAEYSAAEAEWLSVMTRDHITRPARYSHTHFAALLQICVRKFGPLHWTAAALACGVLEQLAAGHRKDMKVSKKGLVRMALLVRFLGMWDAYYRHEEETDAHGLPVLLATRAAGQKVLQVFDTHVFPVPDEGSSPAVAGVRHSIDKDANFDALTPDFLEWQAVFHDRADRHPSAVMARLVPEVLTKDWPSEAVAIHQSLRGAGGAAAPEREGEWWLAPFEALFGDLGADAMRVQGAEKKLLHAMKTKADPLSNPYSSHQQSMDGYVDGMLHTLGHERDEAGEHDQSAYMELLSKLHHGDDWEERKRQTDIAVAKVEEQRRQDRRDGKQVPPDHAGRVAV